MNSSNSRSISPTLTPLSSSASRRTAVSASSPSTEPSGRFDQHPVGMSVEEDRQAELACQENGAGDRVVKEDDDPVAVVVGLGLHLPPPRTVTVEIVERRLAQDVPVIR